MNDIKEVYILSLWCSGCARVCWLSQSALIRYQDEHKKSVCVSWPHIFTPPPFNKSSRGLLRSSPGPLKCFFSCLEERHRSRAGLTTQNLLLYFQSSAAAPGSSPAAVGRCNVSQCPGSATAGQHARTRVTRWTVPVSIAHLSPFTPALLPNTYNVIGFWRE